MGQARHADSTTATMASVHAGGSWSLVRTASASSLTLGAATASPTMSPRARRPHRCDSRGRRRRRLTLARRWAWAGRPVPIPVDDVALPAAVLAAGRLWAWCWCWRGIRGKRGIGNRHGPSRSRCLAINCVRVSRKPDQPRQDRLPHGSPSLSMVEDAVAVFINPRVNDVLLLPWRRFSGPHDPKADLGHLGQEPQHGPVGRRPDW